MSNSKSNKVVSVGSPVKDYMRVSDSDASLLDPSWNPHILSHSLASSFETMDVVTNMVNELKPGSNSNFQASIKNVLQLMCAQFTSMKQAIESFEIRFMQMNKQSLINSERAAQYSRRSTLIVSGLQMDDGENQSTLQNNVCQLLSDSGVSVKAVDLSHCYRNSGKPRKVPTKDGKSKMLPPSITVSFVKSSKKDNVLKSYSNFNSSTRKRKPVTISQSLTPYFNKFRRSLSDHLSTCCDVVGRCKWIHYRSPTSGFCIKTEKNHFTNIFCITDLTDQIHALGMNNRDGQDVDK